ncbi:MAG TPA: hypothetical protein VN765_08110 [Candidatus Acidoferrum sp.]|nr:hypothetical protein [Candidatus Acidoferrum sp.]
MNGGIEQRADDGLVNGLERIVAHGAAMINGIQRTHGDFGLGGFPWVGHGFLQTVFIQRRVVSSLMKAPYSVVFPSAFTFAHLALAAALMAALPAALIRLLPFLTGLGVALVAFVLAQRIFLALARALISLRRWAAESLRFFFFAGLESVALVPLMLAQRAFAAADILALTAADLRPFLGVSRLDGIGISPPPAMETSWLCSVSICSLMVRIWWSWVVVKVERFVMGNT